MDLKFLRESFKKGGSIHIKKKNRGKFTDYCGGEVTLSCINKAKSSGNPTLVKRAVFAENARKWKHLKGGIIKPVYSFLEGGNIFADYEPIKESKDNLYDWTSKNPFDPVYRVSMPDFLRETEEKKEDPEIKEDKPFEFTYSDYALETPKKDVPKVKSTPKTNPSPNAKYIFDYFINKGLTKEQASGIVGNFLAESELNTKAINKLEKDSGFTGYGRGLALWSNSRVNDFEKFTGIKIEDSTLDLLLDFTWHEMKQRPVLMSLLKKAKTSDESAELIYRGFENGSASSLATPEQLNLTYGEAWRNPRINRVYNYNNELAHRRKRSSDALNSYL